VPNASLGLVVIPAAMAGQVHTTIQAGTSLTLQQLQQLQFRPAKEALALDASERLGMFSFAVIDSASNAADPNLEFALKEVIPIYVSGNPSAAKALELLRKVLGDNAVAINNYIKEFEQASTKALDTDAIDQIDTSLYSKLDPSNPNFVKRAAGEAKLNGQTANFVAGAQPYLFSFNINNEAGVGSDLSPRDGRQVAYHIDYTKGGVKQTADPTSTATTTTQNQIVNTIEVQHLVEASPYGPANDRYFKFISETTLQKYGAFPKIDPVKGLERDKEGNVIYDWPPAGDPRIKTHNGKPLTTLDGQIITTSGYYDFTQREPGGDGAKFIYGPKQADGTQYIIGVDLIFTNNMFGDNEPDALNDLSDDVIVDPGVPVSLLPVLGNQTVTNNTTVTEIQNTVVNQTIVLNQGSAINMIVPNFFPRLLDSPERRLEGRGTALVEGPGGDDDLAGLGFAQAERNGAGARNAAMALAGGGGAGSGELPAQLLQGTGEGEGNADGNAGGNGKQPGPGRGGDGAGFAGDNQAPRQARERGSLLQPLIDNLASSGNDTKAGSFVLSRLQEGSLMGNHLLDALALGAGVLYGFYAPKAAAVGSQGIKGLLQRVQRATGFGAASAALKERRLISVFAMTLENGGQRLVAARVGSEGLTVLAQQDLPAGAGVDTPGSQAQVDFSTKQLLDRLRGSGIGQADQVLVDPRLQNQATLVAGLGESSQLLNTGSLDRGLAQCDAEQRKQLQAWLQNPSSPLPQDNPLAELMRERAANYARSMPPQQASIATMVELGVAMAANPANLS